MRKCMTVRASTQCVQAKKTQDLAVAKPIIRRSLGRSYLRNNGEMVTVWASALESQWQDSDSEIRDTLTAAVESFHLL